MNALMKNLGVIILLIGVLILAYQAFSGAQGNNAVLLGGLLVIIIGFIAHIILNKKFQ